MGNPWTEDERRRAQPARRAGAPETAGSGTATAVTPLVQRLAFPTTRFRAWGGTARESTHHPSHPPGVLRGAPPARDAWLDSRRLEDAALDDTDEGFRPAPPARGDETRARGCMAVPPRRVARRRFGGRVGRGRKSRISPPPANNPLLSGTATWRSTPRGVGEELGSLVDAAAGAGHDQGGMDGGLRRVSSGACRGGHVGRGAVIASTRGLVAVGKFVEFFAGRTDERGDESRTRGQRESSR